ncbi:hypothetical protein [Echinimonas agarilytica]|uniref:Uncharacterized protein n=1 Tax=Echinimonas agarilytica TaxID=1215918 RepID=A0AA42B9A8_9GAMM|nr:hypothetical protein [Echinimonas agarilytica]MCM2680996.1 hypothetical protein [Echinimonas agarilytica]
MLNQYFSSITPSILAMLVFFCSLTTSATEAGVGLHQYSVEQLLTATENIRLKDPSKARQNIDFFANQWS